MTDTPLRRLAAYTAKLAEHHSLAVMGGLVVGVWGEPRATEDLDLLIANTDLDSLDVLGRELGLWVDPSETANLRRAGMTRFRLPDVPSPKIRIDVVTADHPYYLRAIRRSVHAEVEGSVLPVVCAEDLVVLKSLADRPVDRLDVEKVLKVQAGRLDRVLVEKECAAIDIDPPW